MNQTDVRVQMRRIAVAQMDTPAGASQMSVERQFRAEFPDLGDLEGTILNGWLHGTAKGVLNALRRADNAQLSLPGLGEFDGTVTVYNAEGGFVVKRFQGATKDELLADHNLHRLNAAAATAAEQRAALRNETLIPIMDAQGFTTAGEAYDYYLAHGGV